VTLKGQGRGPDIFGCKRVRDSIRQTSCFLNIILSNVYRQLLFDYEHSSRKRMKNGKKRKKSRFFGF